MEVPTPPPNPSSTVDVNPPYGNIVAAAKASLNFSTRNIPGTNDGSVGCAAAASVIFRRATGLNLAPPTKIELSTITVYDKLSRDTTNWRKRTDWRQAQPGDIICTKRKAKAGHVGVVSDTKSADGSFTVISNSSSGFRGSSRGSIQPNYTVKKWQEIASRNPTETAAFEYIGPFKNV